MAAVYFVTHPEVEIDPDKPVPDWSLSDVGKARMLSMLKQPWLASISKVYSSNERKAMDAAEILSRHLDTTFKTIPELGENDRSSTGYLTKDKFEALANLFFEHSAESVQGWETAVAAQNRIVRTVNRLLDNCPGNQSIVIVSHGAVGTLLLCYLNNWSISREYDQPGGGGGNYFSFDRETMKVQSDWKAIDEPITH